MSDEDIENIFGGGSSSDNESEVKMEIVRESWPWVRQVPVNSKQSLLPLPQNNAALDLECSPEIKRKSRCAKYNNSEKLKEIWKEKAGLGTDNHMFNNIVKIPSSVERMGNFMDEILTYESDEDSGNDSDYRENENTILDTAEIMHTKPRPRSHPSQGDIPRPNSDMGQLVSDERQNTSPGARPDKPPSRPAVEPISPPNRSPFDYVKHKQLSTPLFGELFGLRLKSEAEMKNGVVGVKSRRLRVRKRPNK